MFSNCRSLPYLQDSARDRHPVEDTPPPITRGQSPHKDNQEEITPTATLAKQPKKRHHGHPKRLRFAAPPLPPPPSPSEVHLPPVERQWELLDMRRKLHRDNFATQQQRRYCMPVYYQPGSEVEAVQVSSFRSRTDSTDMRTKRKVRKSSPLVGNVPNYTWLEERHYQNIARRLNLTGMDLVRVFMNYPNVIQSSPQITQWLAKRKDDNITHPRLKRQATPQQHLHKAFTHSYFTEPRKAQVDRRFKDVVYEWKDVYQVKSDIYT